MSETEMDPPWSWPEDRWRAAVGQARAGRSLRPKKWKGGARAAIALSFDCTNETGELAAGGTSLARLSQGQYGMRRALPRLLALLRRFGAPATFFVPAVVAVLNPDEVKSIVSAGHEIGLGGWIGESAATLSPEAERDLLTGARDALERIAGTKLQGARTPGSALSPNTLAILRDLGITYDSSLMADDDPHELTVGGEPAGLVEIPVDRIRDDATYFELGDAAAPRPFAAPEAVFDIFRRELEVAYEEGGLFQLTLHPHLIGHRSRIWIVEETLKIARTLPGMWIATHADIAQWCRSRAGG